MVRLDFTIENISVPQFNYNSLDTSLQTSDGRRWEYDSDAYTTEMRRQTSLPEINTGDILRVTEGYIIPSGSKPVKFFYEHPSYGVSDFSFVLEDSIPDG